MARRALAHALPKFAQLSRATRRSLLRESSIEQISAGTVLFTEGQVPKALCLLIDGLIQVFHRDEGREITVLILRPSMWFATEAILGRTPLVTSFRTVKVSLIARVAAAVAQHLFKTDVEFAKAIAEDQHMTYRDAVSELKNLRARTSLQRLVAWILAMEQASNEPGEVKVPYSKTILAARLGVTPETLSRDLAKLNPLGVAVEGLHLKIADADNLRQLTSSNQLSYLPVP